VANITSVCEKVTRNDCSNYRGVGVTGVLGNVFGRTIKEQLGNELKRNLSETQNSFIHLRNYVGDIQYL
jgi:hypothetical protein